MTMKIRTKPIIFTLIIVVLALMLAPLLQGKIRAAPYINNRSLKISSAIAGAMPVNYEFSFDVPAMANLGAIKLSLCSNSPLPELPCNGFNGAGLSSENNVIIAGINGFTVSGTASQTEILLSRPQQASVSTSVTVTIENVTNPTDNGIYFGRIELYPDSDAAQPADYVGGTAISINTPIDVNTYVPPYLYFCAAVQINGLDCSNTVDDYYDFGDFLASQTRTGRSQFITATNASFGYNVTYHGTTLTSGNNTINAMSGLAASNRGQSQFGLNLRRNNIPSVGDEPVGWGPYPTIGANYNIPDRFMFSTGDQLVSIAEPSYFTKYTVSYIVNIPSGQAPGIYSTTLIYLALANF